MRKLVELAKQVYEDFERKHLMVIAAGLAYYFLMSLAPGLLLLAGIMAYLPIHNGLERATSFVAYVVPQQVFAMFEAFLNSIGSHRTSILSAGIIVSLWLTSKGFTGVIAGLDIVYNVPKPRRIWTNRILAFGLAFAVGVLLLLGVMLTLIGPWVATLLSRMVPIHSLWVSAWPYLQWSLSAVFIFAAIELLYRLAPNIPAKHRLTIPGSLIASGLWLALSWALSFYFHHFEDMKVDRLYGFLASPIALILWLYWSALAILIGAEINVALQMLKSNRVSIPESISRDAA